MKQKSDKKLIEDYIKQVRDEERNPQKYDEPGDMPSYYLYGEILARGLGQQLNEILSAPTVHFVIADWKDTEELINGFKKAIKKIFNGKVYVAPSCKGTDTYGFIVSDQKLTLKQIHELDKI